MINRVFIVRQSKILSDVMSMETNHFYLLIWAHVTAAVVAEMPTSLMPNTSSSSFGRIPGCSRANQQSFQHVLRLLLRLLLVAHA